MLERPLISVVSPVYKAEKLINLLVNRIKTSLEKFTTSYEIILVDDCGPDNSWQRIQENALIDSRVKGVKLSRNFGQHYAITAGLDQAKGKWVVVMDCDLQDRPEEIINLYKKAQEGYDIVLARRFERQDKFTKKLFSKLFYNTLGYLTGTEQDSSIANFGIYHIKVVKAICSMRESIRYFPTMVKWVGFKRTVIDVEHAERPEGETSYNFKRLFNLALDIILAYSDKPIRLTVKTGLLISVCSLFFALLTLIRYLTGQITVIGYTSLVVSIWFLSGLIISILGVIGFYIGKTFEGVKARPIYIIAEKTYAEEPSYSTT
jgi:glycosyltransferase involved in cell wall biosynthesis